MCGNDRKPYRLTADTGPFCRLMALRPRCCGGAACSVLASAQAWLPSKGTFSTAFVISDVLNTQHWLPDGSLTGEREPDFGHTRSTTYAFLLQVSPTGSCCRAARTWKRGSGDHRATAERPFQRG